MATTLTRNQLVTYAGRRAGNESLTTSANDWLANIVDTLSQNYKWPEFQKTSTGTITNPGAGQTVTTSLPADFGDLWDVHSLIVIDSNGNQQPLTPQPPEWYDLLTNPATLGKPLYVVFNLNTLTWKPYPTPETSYAYQMRYRIKPTRLETDTTIPFASDDIFIQALYVQILQHEDDERYMQEQAVLDRMISRYLGGFNKSPIKSRTVRLNTNAFKPVVNFR